MWSQEIYIRQMLADAVTEKGRRLCEAYGMTLVKSTDHNSNIFEVALLPPEFRPVMESSKELKKFYKSIYGKIKKYLLS